ncbi:MAG: type II 3-dehydroquinate dehydratase [Polyangiaceae bacterium]|nr:type II 3-dehydroquinate dehydratase [Polyangiaceae bacterium]
MAQLKPARGAATKSVRAAIIKAKPSARGTAPKACVYVLSGPNLNRLGKREPEVYGKTTLEEVHTELARLAQEAGASVVCRQSNYEGELIGWIEEAQDIGAHAILINPGALTHTSYALHDAIKGAGLPTVEVHISNPAAREAFRHHSCVARACLGTVSGFGAASYRLALAGILARLASS